MRALWVCVHVPLAVLLASKVSSWNDLNSGNTHTGPEASSTTCSQLSLSEDASSSLCVESAVSGQPIWNGNDRQEFQDPMPLDLLDGTWAYFRVPYRWSNGGGDGGFRGSFASSMLAVECCAVHESPHSTPSGDGTWTAIGTDTYAITGHGGKPLKCFSASFEATSPVTVRCWGNWATGVFFKKPQGR